MAPPDAASISAHAPSAAVPRSDPAPGPRPSGALPRQPVLPAAPGSILDWPTAQGIIVAGAAVLWLCLLLKPAVGLAILWNVLIPVAPLLMVVAAGLWRNACPLATLALLPRRLGMSRARRLPAARQDRLQLAGVAALLLIVPLRHVLLDRHGPASALLLLGAALLAVALGACFDWKSAWCSGLCPVHPVEKLYGARVGASLKNAHCQHCAGCMRGCPDSLPARLGSTAADRPGGQPLASLIMVGGFPGFVVGWFLVPDYEAASGWRHLADAYLLPFAGLALSLALFLVLQRLVAPPHRRLLGLAFAALAVAAYYWFRLPALLGFGLFPDDGVLVDLSATLPAWSPVVMHAATTGFFLWWFLLRPTPSRAWLTRPRAAAAAAAPGPRLAS